jgi:hypothetical protein
MNRSKRSLGTRQEVAIRTWQQIDSESVGAPELELIQKALREALGEGAVESPASIARMLADAGARLRHPEVLECDTRWREERLSSFVNREEFRFTTVAEAVESFARLEQLRAQFAGAGDEVGLRQLRQLGLKLRREFEFIAAGQSSEEPQGILARELDRWLAIWLQTPDLFSEWLALRRRSPEFIKTLGPTPGSQIT